MKARTIARTKRIVLDPRVMVGKPVIRGTRITVEHILNLLAQEETVDQIVSEYPRLTEAHVYAAIEYAYHQVANEEIYAF